MHSSTLPKAAVTKAPSGEPEPQTDNTADQRRRKRVDVRKALRGKARGLTYQEIADQQGVRKQSVHRSLFPLINRGRVEVYRNRQAEIADGVALVAAEIVAEIAADPERRKKISYRDAMVGHGIGTDKSRLISGQSTSNVALSALVELVERQERERVPARPRDLGVIPDHHPLGSGANVLDTPSASERDSVDGR